MYASGQSLLRAALNALNVFAQLQPFIFKGGVFGGEFLKFAPGGGALVGADGGGELFVQRAGARGDVLHARFYGGEAFFERRGLRGEGGALFCRLPARFGLVDGFFRLFGRGVFQRLAPLARLFEQVAAVVVKVAVKGRDATAADEPELVAHAAQQGAVVAHEHDGAVKAGDGFACAALRGSQAGDSPQPDGQGGVRFASNHAGGVLGGISSGQDIEVSVAIKPTSSILIEQPSMNTAGDVVQVATRGRHDPCVGLRAAPILESLLALVLMEHALAHRAQCGV